MSDLLATLREFDGKAVTILSEARAQFDDNDSLLSELTKLIDSQDSHVADGATWLIKDCVERGIVLKPNTVKALITRLNGVSTWQAALHLCQIGEYLDLKPDQAKHYGEWATQYLDHKRPFVRAWSVSALQYAARQTPDLADAANTALTAAAQDKAASVRARARQFGGG